MIQRIIDLPEKQSFFLFGSRQTGKSTLIKALYPSAWTVDLLKADPFLKYSKDLSLFREQAVEEIRKKGIRKIFLDEIQRLPDLLNEVQVLMSQFPDCQFILTGSSARKLKRGGANLLGGRAVLRHLFPLMHEELKEDFRLEDVLYFGSLPSLWGKVKEEKRDLLTSYVQTYLREEIQSEGLVRNLGAYSRLLDLAASQFTEILNFSTLARECYVSVKTLQSYYEILEDTLLGFRLEPWRRSARKRFVGHPKFYFFDNGVTNAINRVLGAEPTPLLSGRLFEQWIVQETYRMIHYRASEASLYFWRTHQGAEVDLLIEKHGRLTAAVEIKYSSNIAGAHLSGLRSFQTDHSGVPGFVVSLVDHPYEREGVRVLPWADYLKEVKSLI